MKQEEKTKEKQSNEAIKHQLYTISKERFFGHNQNCLEKQEVFPTSV